MNTTPDEVYLKKALRGDKAAFGKLVEKYMRLAGAVAYSVVGNFHEAADIVQTAFIKAYDALDTIKNPGSFKSWLTGIVKTTAIDHLRARKKTVSIDSVGELRDEKAYESATSFEDHEREAKILELVSELPEHYREVIILKHMENLSYREISQLIGETEGAVESRLFRARQLLKSKLERDMRHES